VCLCVIINYCGWLGVKCISSVSFMILFVCCSFLAVISLSMLIKYKAASSYILFVCLYCFVVCLLLLLLFWGVSAV